ncbi:Similar to Whrn: Whirlin (Rattus norvegicus) [Cotesia congregata]|uniref:Similar to Whrn: Whirlin (Rattus norvegicus) n=1 Tax=Cotesia congregata TaxID=51543 RepID=A0A8J2MQW7_COTCN|nr:Similar to Whrn: Whirlin (Rattus norvegicus) [Cotesia congregata]
MASSTEDYGSELQELQWDGGGIASIGGGGGGSSTHFLRSSTNLLRNTGGSSTVGCYEAEDLDPISGGGGGGVGASISSSNSSRHIGHNRGYYSPPGTSYTIVERPPSAPHHHSSHTTPYRHHRGHTTNSSGAISPEQVLRIFNNGVAERRQNERRTPASSPASVSALRGTNSTLPSSSSAIPGGQIAPTSPTSQSSVPQALSLQELTVRTITMTRDPPDSHHGFGICVKGGKDAGVGVYISRVEEGSVAERAGLRPGDTILEVNGTPFRAVTHEEALKMLKSCRTLSMTVRGPALDPRCRGGHPIWTTGSGRQQSCSWMDRQGRPASPPPLHPHDSRYGSRTRKVELCIEPGQSLGLMIRGGLEYGLGIYVTGVDKDSVADRAGLLVGDQIIQVNGTSFEEATHDEAVEILKTNKRMSLIIRDVGKVPHSCTTSRPIVVPRYPNTDHDPQSILSSPGNNNPPSPTNTNEWRHRGVHTLSSATASMVEEKARVVLARSERVALTQLIGDYRTRRLNIQDLVANLADLLNTQEKLTLLTELREVIDSKDRAIFDELVYRPRASSSARRQKGDRAHSDLIVTPSIHDLPRGVQSSSSCRPGRLMDLEGDPLGVTGPLPPRDNQEYRSPSEDSGLGSDMPRTRAGCRRTQHQVATSDLTLSNDDEYDNQDYDDEIDNDRGRRHSSPGGSRSNQRDYSSHHNLYPDNLENDGVCESSDVEMIGNGRRDRETEDEEEGREERSSEGGSVGGFGGWRSHLLGGLTQRVKSWYWGARPLELAHKLSRSFDMQEAQLLEEGATKSGGTTGNQGGNGPPRRHHSAQRLSRNDIGERLQKDGALVVPDHQGNLRITVKKTKSILGIAIEGGANTKHPLPRIINIHDNGAAFEAGGLHHQEVARLIAESFARRDRNEIEFLVVEAKKSNLEPKPTALIFLEAFIRALIFNDDLKGAET